MAWGALVNTVLGCQSPFSAGTVQEQGNFTSLDCQPVWRHTDCVRTRCPWFLEELLWGVFSKLIYHTETHLCSCLVQGSWKLALQPKSRDCSDCSPTCLWHFKNILCSSKVKRFSKATRLSKSEDLKISPAKSCLSNFFGNWLVIH